MKLQCSVRIGDEVFLAGSTEELKGRVLCLSACRILRRDKAPWQGTRGNIVQMTVDGNFLVLFQTKEAVICPPYLLSRRPGGNALCKGQRVWVSHEQIQANQPSRTRSQRLKHELEKRAGECGDVETLEEGGNVVVRFRDGECASYMSGMLGLCLAKQRITVPLIPPSISLPCTKEPSRRGHRDSSTIMRRLSTHKMVDKRSTSQSSPNGDLYCAVAPDDSEDFAHCSPYAVDPPRRFLRDRTALDVYISVSAEDVVEKGLRAFVRSLRREFADNGILSVCPSLPEGSEELISLTSYDKVQLVSIVSVVVAVVTERFSRSENCRMELFAAHMEGVPVLRVQASATVDESASLRQAMRGPSWYTIHRVGPTVTSTMSHTVEDISVDVKRAMRATSS